MIFEEWKKHYLFGRLSGPDDYVDKNLRAAFDAINEECVKLYIENEKLKSEIVGPDGFATWKDAAIHERILRTKSDKAAREECAWIAESWMSSILRVTDVVAGIAHEIRETISGND